MRIPLLGCNCCFLLKQDLYLMGTGDSTNDIAHLLGMLDPWYERNTLSLLNLPANVVCQVQLKYNFYTDQK